MPKSIFVSYRRDDSAGYAGRIFEHLAEHFGEDEIFRDVDTLRPGEDFVETIQSAVGSCKALVLIIGREWLTTTDKKGRRRLDDPHDFVRLEVKTALDRRIPVIPVLLENVSMPDEEELPEDLKPLRRRQALDVSDKRFDYDIKQLIESLERIVKPEARTPVATPSVPPPQASMPQPLAAPFAPKPDASTRWKYVAAAALLVAAVVAGKFVFFPGSREPESEPTGPAETVAKSPVQQPAEPRIISFGASKRLIAPGSPVRLRWQVENASGVSIDPGMPQSPVSAGDWTTSPNETTTYELVAVNSAGVQKRQSITVNVGAPPASEPLIEQFSASPPQVKAGEAVSIEWKVRNAQRVELKPLFSGLVEAQGKSQDRPDEDRTYTLTATSSTGRKVSESINVTIQQKPKQAVIEDFDASPSRIKQGEKTIVSWKVSGADRVTLTTETGSNKSDQQLDLSGRLGLAPPADTTYTLTAQVLGQPPVSRSLPVAVQIAGPQPSATKIRMQLKSIEVREDGSNGDTGWYFVVNYNGAKLIQLAPRKYNDDRVQDKTGIDPSLRPVELVVISGQRAKLDIQGYRVSGNKLVALGAAIIRPAAHTLRVEVKGRPEKEGWFVFEFDFTPVP